MFSTRSCEETLSEFELSHLLKEQWHLVRILQMHASSVISSDVSEA